MSVVTKWLTSALCARSCQLMAPHHISNSFLAPGLSHAYGHVMPLQCCVDVDVEGNTQALNVVQKTGHLQNNKVSLHQISHLIKKHV